MCVSRGRKEAGNREDPATMRRKAERSPRDSRAFRGTVDHRNWVVLRH